MILKNFLIIQKEKKQEPNKLITTETYDSSIKVQ